jgi:hypothetical protein
MELRPNTEIFQRRIKENKELAMSLVDSEGKFVTLLFSTHEAAQKWHRALREGLAELIFNDAFQKDKRGSLSIRKLEKAIVRGTAYVPPANCHMLRARNILAAKQDVQSLLNRLTHDPHSVSREEVRAMMHTVDADPVSNI